MIHELFMTSRPISWVNTAFPFASAYLLTTGVIDWLWIVGTIFFLIPYNLAMYGINDVFDYESDLLNPRKGGAEGALVERSRHRGILIACLVATVPFLVVLGIAGSWEANLVLLVSMLAVLAYSAPKLRFKERPFVDSLTSSTHFVSPAVYGMVLAGAQFNAPLLALLLAFFLWGMASHAFGAVQDIVPDRAASLGSIGTVLGAKWTVRGAALAYLAAGVLLLATEWPGPLAGLLALPYVANVLPYANLNDVDSERAHTGWVRFLWLNYVTGFFITMILIWYAFVR
ncbi:prenyltransferase [Paeniglutamicibacter gangotriensis]|uniref:Prenyltransferase n=1 Tax=Paeniglutamicibacter gangotriensis Lz1y TaxID=1276920 RepID=M7NCZ1_9MICC|nr:prenyltransferase [Paeniglutamicibacter gangotriensis]EMQ99674.1 prenyltransferase [Paeniglutamicibacter gangotriensis Lz1y]